MASCYFCKRTTGESYDDRGFAVPISDGEMKEEVRVCKKCKEVIRAIANGEAYDDWD